MDSGQHEIAFCFAEGEGDRWEAFCTSFDLAVQGRSFEEVYEKLNAQIDLYLETVMAEAPAIRAKLARRRAPLSLRLRPYLLLARAMFRRQDTKERHEYTRPVGALAAA